MTATARTEALRRRFRFYGALAEQVGSTALRLVRGGKTHPDWPVAYELAMSFLRVMGSEGYYDFGIALARKRDSPITPSVARKVRVRTDTLAGLDVDVHEPRAGGQGATVLFLHGGGYVTCSPRSHRDVVARLCASAGARCIVPDYRLAPSHPYPAALDDALQCYRALLAQGVSPSSLIVAGDSAGGGLSVSLVLRLRALGEPLPAGLVLLSPWVDLSLSRAALTAEDRGDYLGVGSLTANAAQYVGAHDPADPGLSPVYADLHGLPPTLIETGEWETLCAQNAHFAERARAAGVDVQHTVVPGLLHAFVCFAAILPQGAQAIERAAAFIRARTRQPSAASPRDRASYEPRVRTTVRQSP
jgi:epsilon-lactone hydrolase